MASLVRQLLATLFVTLSLALFALCDTDLTGGFCLRTLSFGEPMIIVGPVLDMVVVSRAVVGTSCEELGWCVIMGLLHPFTASSKGALLCLLECNTTGL
jgi:hypothetical protein